MFDARDAAMAALDLAVAHDLPCNAWLHTIALLQPQPHAPSTAPSNDALRAHAPMVSIIERPTAALAVVSWRDATRCRYGEQIWAIATAGVEGVCALTGAPIARSDMVYRPQRSRPPALNAEAMILAAAIDDACGIAAP